MKTIDHINTFSFAGHDEMRGDDSRPGVRLRQGAESGWITPPRS
ncbi:hypothetical protein [Sphingobium cupriresistens]|nr:hypothetical protein [Sphingobium cupriresistens]